MEKQIKIIHESPGGTEIWDEKRVNTFEQRRYQLYGSCVFLLEQEKTDGGVELHGALEKYHALFLCVAYAPFFWKEGGVKATQRCCARNDTCTQAPGGKFHLHTCQEVSAPSRSLAQF
jgi:hypothetical protein